MRSLLVVLLLLAIACPAQAELFVRPKKDNVLPDVPAQQQQQAPAPEISPVPEAQPPAKIETTPTPESPETIASFAMRYKENCMLKKDPVLKGEPLRMLCECSAAKMQEKMTVDEVKTMITDTPEGQAQRNRMVVHVYAPCMEYPTRALLYHNCGANKDVLTKYKNADKLCTCMADDMARFIAANGPAVLAQRLMETPDDPDPLGGFLASEGFQKQTQNAFMACVGRFPITP